MAGARTRDHRRQLSANSPFTAPERHHVHFQFRAAWTLPAGRSIGGLADGGLRGNRLYPGNDLVLATKVFWAGPGILGYHGRSGPDRGSTDDQSIHSSGALSGHIRSDW